MAGDDEVARCDCGYLCQGATDDERIADARRHAHDVHGIDVSAEQVLGVTGAGAGERRTKPFA